MMGFHRLSMRRPLPLRLCLDCKGAERVGQISHSGTQGLRHIQLPHLRLAALQSNRSYVHDHHSS